MGTKIINKYYKGVLECQFEIKDSNGPNDPSINKLIDTIGKIELTERFWFREAQEIKEIEYQTFLNNKEDCILTQNDINNVDFLQVQAKGLSQALRKTLFQVALKFSNIDKTQVFEASGIHVQDDNRIIPADLFHLSDERVLSVKRALPMHEYSVKYSGLAKKHASSKQKLNGFGRIHGEAVCIIQETIEVSDPLKPEEPTLAPIIVGAEPKLHNCKFTDKNNIQCSNQIPINDDLCATHNSDGLHNRGCFKQNGCFNNDYTSGCFNAIKTPFGCFGYQIPTGCGLLGIIPLILALALLWCFIFGDCGKGCRGEQNSREVIHDTVYVEVYREIKDTIETIQMDTLSVLDSITVKKTYMVPLPNVNFITDSDILVEGSKKDLDSLASYLKKHPEWNATIEGHTDDAGDAERNLKLSKARATRVKNYLVNKGINASRITAIGYGETRPKSKGKTKEDRMLNRRVEVTLTNTTSTEKVEIKDSRKK